MLISDLRTRLFSFQGRLSHKTFWGTALLAWATFFVLLVFLETLLGRNASLVLYPPMFWSIASLCVRRLHDRARSAWWLLCALVPIIGPVWLAFELGFRRGTAGENQYGQDPTMVGIDYLTVA
jgi:uncharacterized membrane protein YhaH (DUF805 family)